MDWEINQMDIKTTFLNGILEAKYMATSHCTKETVWLRIHLANVLEKFISIMCDNQGCITFAKNLTHPFFIIYIDVQDHFIRKN